jgi:hypothetical protein
MVKEIIFSDYPEFRPNLTPREIFKLGSFGGTYWRPIYSSITNKHYKDIHHKYPKSWFDDIPENKLSNEYYNKDINKYKVKVGTSLEFWEEKKWITKYNPYGWVHWYCDFYNGNRTADDSRQIHRWLRTAGPNSRFRKWLIRLVKENNKEWNDYSVSPAIRQTLQHWGYQLVKSDVD